MKKNQRVLPEIGPVIDYPEKCATPEELSAEMGRSGTKGNPGKPTNCAHFLAYSGLWAGITVRRESQECRIETLSREAILACLKPASADLSGKPSNGQLKDGAPSVSELRYSATFRNSSPTEMSR
jgi:hypothetical protein